MTQSYQTIHVRTEDDIALITVYGPPLNNMSDQLIADLGHAFEEVFKYDWIKGVVLTGTGSHFIGGWDINTFPRMTDKTHCLPRMMRAHRLLNRIEAGPKPVVAAINGNCSRGGMEVAMACHYRIAAASVRLGLLDVRFGLIPGLGGTQRLPRLVGVETALEMMTAGRDVPAAMAEELGLIEEAVPDETLIEEALKTADAFSTGLMSLQASMTSKRVDNLVDGATKRRLLERFRERLDKTERGYIAPFKVVDALEQGLGNNFDSDIQKEISLFCECAVSDVCRNLITIFLATRAAGKIERYSRTEPMRVRRIGVMGTGSQAAAISAYLVQCGFEVWLWEMDQEQVRNGLNRVRSVLKADIRSGRITKNEFEILITQRLRLTTSLSDFGDADLVFDAFRTDLETRRAVYATLEDACRRDTLIASAHPVRESDLLAGMLQHPQRLLGIRFVNPLKRMQLVEISAGPDSADGVVGTAVHFVRRIGKTPVVVNDIPGFFVNRILLSIISEFCYLVGQGINPYHIDSQITEFGMAVGPAQMCDFNSIVQISEHIEYLRHRLGERWEVPPICQHLSEAAAENHGSGAGWYVYQGELPAPNLKYLDTLKGYLSQNGLTHKRVGGEEILSRILARALNEAAFAFQDDISNAIPELDLAVVYGVGFPPYRGGIFRYADTWGIGRVVQTLKTLSNETPRFAPAPLLEEMAQTGKTFYDI